MEHYTLGCVIFDLDGTILDSMTVWSKIDQQILQQYGLSAPDDLTEQVKKMTIAESSQYFIDQFQLSCTPKQFTNMVREMAAVQYREKLQLKPGVLPLLDALDQANVPYCIATATYPTLAETALKRLGIWERIAFLITETEVGVGKTQPLIYRQAASRMGCGKRQTVVVEDALHAVQTATRDGFFTVGVREETMSKEEWIQVQQTATVAVDDLSVFLEAIYDQRIPLKRRNV